MGHRKQRRKPTRREKMQGSGARDQGSGTKGSRGRIGFEDLSPMAQGIVADIAKRQRCTREEIVEVLND